jgi:hypothetical protein
MTTTESALMTTGASQLYLAIGDQSPDGSTIIRLYHKPLMLFNLAWSADDGWWRIVARRPLSADRGTRAGKAKA